MDVYKVNQKTIKETPKDDIACLTGYARDKEISGNYCIKVPTIMSWKNKSLDDEDSWRRIVYELFVRYIPEKDIYRDNENKNSEEEIMRNITTLEIGQNVYSSFVYSPKEFKSFIIKIIENTPPDVFKRRIDFLKECVDSSVRVISK